MKAKHLFAAACVATSFGFSSLAFAGGEGWIHDFEAAKKQAAAENKDLLIDFTGSDWCIWCKKLNEEVFSHDEFKNGVKDKFVLVELDYPQDKEKAGVTEEIAKQNAELAKTYAIAGYPTIMLCEASGKPFAQTGYQKDGPQKYVDSLNELRGKKTARDEAFKKAASETGVAKAKTLVSAIETMGLTDETFANSYSDVIAQIKEADPKDETGFSKKLNSKKKMEEFGTKMQELSQKQDAEGAMALVETSLKDDGFDKEQLQQISMVKVQVFASQGKFDEALKAVEDTQKIDPESEFSKKIEAIKGRLTTMKEQAASKGTEPKEKEGE